MHVVVVGCGRVGSGLAVRLVDQGHSVSIVDKAARAFRRLPPDWPGNAVVGRASTVTTSTGPGRGTPTRWPR